MVQIGIGLPHTDAHDPKLPGGFNPLQVPYCRILCAAKINVVSLIKCLPLQLHPRLINKGNVGAERYDADKQVQLECCH